MVQKSIKKHLSRIIKKHKNGALVIMRLPYKLYSEANHLSITFDRYGHGWGICYAK